MKLALGFATYPVVPGWHRCGMRGGKGRHARGDFVAWRLRSALAPARDQLRDTDADGLPEIEHSIERFERNCDSVTRRASSRDFTISPITRL